ncbi:DUF5710 domain-containing protein [Chromobacterium piscinae]|uniref:DUF5710 domain-containing protein n=1 Tax=Chromobacterium piscinae TaxID=686831 RepID=UPI001E58B65E|nr:DUF5710 domain-containing protein [Chromobacterium piscinae]MCD5327946.1 DUF5710 domain-containing protein [Chromobacterium piscinae]
MQIQFGCMQWNYNNEGGKIVPVIWDALHVVNPHMAFCGKSGSGKSHQLRRAVHAASRTSQTPVRFHIFDRHGDLRIPGESAVRFSESSPYGFNPLEVNPDPHFGGVRRAIQKFLAGVNRTATHKLGPLQEALMRRLLEELYASRGYNKDDYRTWLPDDPAEIAAKMYGKDNRIFLDVPYSQRERVKELGARWDADLRAWWVEREQYAGDLLMWDPKVLFKSSPTLSDAVAFAERKMKAIFLGTNAAAMGHLAEVNRVAAAVHRLAIKLNKESRDDELEKLGKRLDDAREKALASYKAYLHTAENGRELDEVIHYRSMDVMTSVFERLSNLNSIGIFRNTPPPHDPAARVWRYDISALESDEAKLFVHFKLSQMFDDARQRGEQPYVRDIAGVDEADMYFDDDENNILNKIAKEARKFGLGLWAASQSPAHFSEDFISNLGAKVILYIDPTKWDASAKNLKIERKKIELLRPKYNGLIQIINNNDVKSTYNLTLFPNEKQSA